MGKKLFARFIMLLLSSFVWFGVANAAKSDYMLGPGDVVKITVYGHPDMATESRISQSNAITFPLVGEVRIGGGTAADAEAGIAKLLEQGGYIKQPHVNVIVTLFRSQQISVLGEVNRPGKYPVEGKSTLLDILVLAGGINQLGADSVVLVRTGKDDVSRKTDIDLLGMFKTGDLSANVEVFNDDVIYVPRASQFYIYGEVQRPGAFRLERNMIVMQALSVGGGLTLRGSANRVFIKRRNGKGEIQTLEAPGLIQPLQADDVIFVKESLF